MNLKDPLLLKTTCLIDGQWISRTAVLSVTNPATGEEIATVPLVSAEDVTHAINAANAAWPTWRSSSAEHRGRCLKRWYQLILEHKDDLATIMTSEQGKPLTEAVGEINYAASYVEWFAEEALRVQGEVLPGATATQRIMVSRQPVGVCVAITPWNFPAAMITRKVAPALAAGCTIIVKPASQTPLTALALAELAIRAGIPAGVLQVITGKAAVIGDIICSNPLVRKLSFTGSTEIGAQLMAKCATDIKKLSLELGGNAPYIVFEDADLDLAVENLLKAKFRNAGQTCISPNRVYVQQSIMAVFAERLTAAVAKLEVGNGLTAGVEIGPLIDLAAVAKVTEHVADAIANGARVLTGGKASNLGGSWYLPTVLANVPATALCANEETFGPLVPLIAFDTEAEVLSYANNTPFGLAAYFFSDNLHRVYRVAEQLEAGMIGINTGVISAAHAPFGGIKASGLGREGAHAGIEEYLEMKYQCFAIKTQ